MGPAGRRPLNPAAPLEPAPRPEEAGGGGGRSLRTERLLLRRWRPDDLDPFAELNADPEVMELFPGTLTRAETEAVIEKAEEVHEELGFGPWAVEELTSGELVGSVGILPLTFESNFSPGLEIGWRLVRRCWGRGYASEAAREALADGFRHSEVPEIVAFTAAKNERSMAVMERIGMRRDPDEDFTHPALPADHPLQPHVLYRVHRDEALAQGVLTERRPA